MLRIIKTEIWKLKRYNIIWAGILLMLLSVLLTLFMSTANDGSVWDFRYLCEQVIKNNMVMIFPMCITLIEGYIINREQKDDTLKSIFTIPISFKKLLVGKLIVGGFLSLLLGVICTIFTVMAELIIRFPGFTGSIVIQSLWQITFFNLFLYISVLPIIILTSKLSKGFLAGVVVALGYGYIGVYVSGSKDLCNIYPITASLGLIQYRSYDAAVNWNMPFCVLSIVTVLLFCFILVHFIGDGVQLNKAARKRVKTTYKKGW